MGGLAGAAGEGRLNEPRWLIGGGATLTVAVDAPTLWVIDLDDPVARARAEAVPLLAGEAEATAGRRDAGERLLRRRLARLLFGVAGGCRPDAVALGHAEAGAPVVHRPGGWHLSLAARWPLCAIAVAPYPLGVDIERIEEKMLPADLMTDTERLQAGPAPLGDAARIWVAKEAHAKWTGRPRDLDPAAIETGHPPLVTSSFGITRCWPRDVGDHVAAVCTA